MLYAMWNNKVIDAELIAETEVTETPVRKASGKELRCIDPHCEHPVIGYKHGPHRKPHFFHLVNGNCDYSDFDKTDNSFVRDARKVLYHHFYSLGYDVEREQKLLNSRKYSHLLFHIGERNIVLQIAQPSTTAKYIDEFTAECERCGFELKWIVLGNCYDYQSEKHNYHAARYLFNHSTYKDLLVLDMETEKVSQTKHDGTSYTYKGFCLKDHLNYNIDYFNLIKPIGNLILFDGEPTLSGFHEAYEDWQVKKQEEFEKMKYMIDEREKKREITSSVQKIMHDNFVNNTISRFELATPISINHDKPNLKSSINQYVLGTRIVHNTYGIGYITKISLLSECKHIIRVRYYNTYISHELEILIEQNLIRIL